MVRHWRSQRDAETGQRERAEVEAAEALTELIVLLRREVEEAARAERGAIVGVVVIVIVIVIVIVVVVFLLFIIYTINLSVVRPRSCRVIYYFDTPALGRRHQSFGRVKFLAPLPGR